MGVLGVNHLAFRTHDPNRLRRFYLDLTRADEIEGDHGPIGVGQTLLVFFASLEHGAGDDPDGRRLEFIHDDPGVGWRE